MQKRKFGIMVFAATALWLLLIWGNSMADGETSSELSGGLLAWLQSVIPFFSLVSEYLLRKLAHFSEYAILGMLLAADCRMLGARGIHSVTSPLLPGVLAACVDETIQLFSEGRGSSLIDVWIDSAGALTGIVLLLLLTGMLRKRRKAA